MILRVYRAIALDGRQPAFQKFLEETAIPTLRNQDGLEHLIIGWPHHDSPREFSLVQVWRDMESMKAFTGDRWQNVVMHPVEERLLEKAHVTHYEAG